MSAHIKSMRIISLTSNGLQLAQKLQEKHPEATLSHKPDPFKNTVQKAFLEEDALIFICATGIVIRTLAPILKDKYRDPAVLVLDERGEFVIPLLSGHEGGANQLAAQLAKSIDAKLVITTANQYVEPIYTVGMGCERDCPEAELKRLLEDCLAKAELGIHQIHSISSIDIKADERGLLALAESYNKPYHTYSAKQLASVEEQLSVKSDYVYNTVGVYGVAESAALYDAKIAADICSKNNAAELILNKQKNARATCAIAKAYKENIKR